ncbi:MAG: hypothetical protein ACKVOS_03635 [Sphingorhabdus sp.]|uniref:hypothetical protein n=1 Tax=Sphingorhabdus sp. TaxID=1902408 RepID=UPI0038FCE54F
MSRFANLSANRGAIIEPINWGDPGDYRNRGKGEALVPSTDAKYSKRLPEFRPLLPASSAKASTTVAPAAPKLPIKSAAPIAAEATNARINAVFDNPASNGKKKAAGKLLHMTKASASEIIAQLKSVEPDAVVEARETDAAWKRAASKANRMAGFNDEPDEPAAPESAVATGWAKAVAKVNTMNGFGGSA